MDERWSTFKSPFFLVSTINDLSSYRVSQKGDFLNADGATMHPLNHQ